jgi:RimJ/RimL family protein N-acetyltransferase
MPDRLETERLTLTPWADVPIATSQALVTERGEGRPTEADIAGRLQLQRDRYASDGFALYALRPKPDDAVIGYCGLVVGRSTPAEPELAYELFRDAHGRGFATEAAAAVVHAAAATGRERLWATVRTWNAPSFRVLDKLGFDRDHTTTDERGEIVWCVLALRPARLSGSCCSG